MSLIDKFSESIEKLIIIKERIRKKNEAKAEFSEKKSQTIDKEPCIHCQIVNDDILQGDKVLVLKTKTKKFCTDPWHQTIGIISEIDLINKEMIFLGYANKLNGFEIIKICPVCYRTIKMYKF